MSKQELQRADVLAEVVGGQRTMASAANLLGVSLRQAQRLLARYREGGGAALIHQARGRTAHNRLDDAVRDTVLELVRQHYRDFGPTLAAEFLFKRHRIDLSRETLRRWMTEADLWRSRRQRRTFHPPRHRRECYGELIQIDGSDHRWFEDRAEPCTLLVFIDDATGKLMKLRFVPSESTASYFEILSDYLKTHGCPLALYSDRHSIFRVNRPEAKGGSVVTQFGRAVAELNIESICANSSQAKGRVERANRTLQDRLVKELRLAAVSSMEAGNAFLPGFLEDYNQRFAVPPARTEDLHRKLTLDEAGLADILCHRELRHVGQQLTLSYDRKLITLQRSERSEKLAGQYVDLYDFYDRPLEVRWKGHVLPYGVFEKDQRVNPAAIVENKRLGHALAIVKASQDTRQAIQVQTNSEKGGYRKKGRNPCGPDYKHPPQPKAVEMVEIVKSDDFAHSHRAAASAG